MVDDDGNGFIDFDEFLQILKKGCSNKEHINDDDIGQGHNHCRNKFNTNNLNAIYKFFKDLVDDKITSIDGH